MKICLSVAGDPDASFVVCRTCPSLAGYALAFAQLPGITSQPLPGGGQSWSLPVQTLVFITSLTFIPAILLMMTSFTRIIIVLVYCVTRWERPPRHLTRYCWGWHYF